MNMHLRMKYSPTKIYQLSLYLSLSSIYNNHEIESINSTWEKKHLKKYRNKSVDFFYIEIIIFLLQNAVNTFYNLYYDN